VENAMPGTENLTLTVTPVLGYTIREVTMTQTGATVADSSEHVITPDSGSFPAFGTFNARSAAGITYTFTMPAKHLDFEVTYRGVEKVDRVAYVSEEGRNDLGYNVDYTAGTETRQAATSWGTASNDLQAVINSWTGTNFTEIWVQGTVTPKTQADVTVGSETWKIDEADSNADNKNLAFVIPPGLKIYGGFTGTETAAGTISAGNEPRDKTLTTAEDWRRRTVLSGVLNDNDNAYHVVILADIPDNQATVLDGLTISGGSGASSPGTITAKGYSIDQQSGAGLYLVNASPVLNNVRIQGNMAQANGGGLYNLATGSGKASSPRVSDTMFDSNSVLGNGNGGGIYSSAESGGISQPVFTGITVQRNQTSGRGGGIYFIGENGSTSVPTVTDSRIEGNAASYGGGVSNVSYVQPIYNNVVISKNDAGAGGGGIYNSTAARPVFINVTIAGNSANYGGAMRNLSIYVTMTNATISGNLGGGTGGGGIYNEGGGIVLTNVLFEKNYSSGYGGALVQTFGSIAVITNGIIRDNSATVGGGIYNAYSFTDSDTANDITYMALTNVLITENEARSTGSRNGGGGIYNVADDGTVNGKGLNLVMNNVTIAGNTTAGSGGGICLGSTNAANKITVKANNSIVWDNTASNGNVYDSQNKITWHKSLVEGLTPGGANFAPASFPGGPFVSGYSPVSGLVDQGDSASYPAGAYILLGNSSDTVNDGALQGIGGVRHDDFKALITDAVFNSTAAEAHLKNNNNKDASAGQGDLLHTVQISGVADATVHNRVTVTTNASPTPASTNPRIQGTAIDVGAYEQQ
jgi:hypothetical protein